MKSEMEAQLPQNLVIANATLPGRAGRWCLAIEGTRIAALAEGDSARSAFGDRAAGEAWDVEGRLVSPGLVDAHVHVDKALTDDRVGDVLAAEGLAAAIRAVRGLKTGFSVADVRERATRALGMSVAAGTVHARTYCEADPFVELRAVDALIQIERDLAPVIGVQSIAFPQEGWFRTEGTMEAGSAPWIERAIERGMRIVGGNVNGALWPSSPEAQIDAMFALAGRHDCDLDMHIDNWDGPQSFALPYLAAKTIELGWQGRVGASHIVSLAHVSGAEAANAIDLVKRAGVHVCVLPTRMKLTCVAELLEAGVNLVCGSDNMRDPFVRFGDADLMKALLLLAQITGMLGNTDLERLWLTVTANAARMMRLPRYGLDPGCDADLVVFDAHSVPEAILHQAARLLVLKHGRRVAGALEKPPA
ncbi:MAG: hypothetical protein EXR27_03110 [Betaproteobacteria bacterium]|nr:hypothetical protein [Betaproteobacteria bacterium]